MDNPAMPSVTAELGMSGDSLVIAGEVRRRESAPLNGYVSLAAVDASGVTLWSDNAILSSAGLRFFGYRIFRKEIPLIPPSGSKIIVQFHNAE